MGRTRIRERDSRRTQDLRTIQTAIELYASDYNHYPNTNGTWTALDAPLYVNNDIVNPNAPDIATALQPYLRSALGDPTPGTGGDGYLFFSDGANYCILFYQAPEDMRNYEPHLRAMNRCSSVGTNGQCSSGVNAVYIGTGPFAGGC